MSCTIKYTVNFYVIQSVQNEVPLNLDLPWPDSYTGETLAESDGDIPYFYLSKITIMILILINTSVIHFKTIFLCFS